MNDPNLAHPEPSVRPTDTSSSSAAATAHPPPLLHRVFFGGSGLRAGWGILLFVVLCLVAFLAIDHLRLLPSPPPSPPGQPAPELSPLSSIAGEGALLALVALVTWVLSRVEHRPVGAYGLGGPKSLRFFLHGLLSGIVLLSLLVLFLLQAHLLVIDRLLLPPAAVIEYAAVWAFGFLLVALFEETLLRGYLQFTLTRGLSAGYRHFTTAERAGTFGFWTAALILCSVFGLGHAFNGGETPFGLFAVGLFGLTFVFSLWRTGSLWWGIGAHTSWNWAQSFLYGVGNSGNMIRFHLLDSHPLGPTLLSGGATGPEGSIFVLPTLALLAVAAHFAVRRSERVHLTSTRSGNCDGRGLMGIAPAGRGQGASIWVSRD